MVRSVIEKAEIVLKRQLVKIRMLKIQPVKVHIEKACVILENTQIVINRMLVEM